MGFRSSTSSRARLLRWLVPLCFSHLGFQCFLGPFWSGRFPAGQEGNLHNKLSTFRPMQVLTVFACAGTSSYRVLDFS